MGLKNYDDLRPSQHTIIDGLLDSADQIVVAGMGAGKTAAALTAFADLRERGDVRRGIILAPPLPAATVWPREPDKWHHLRYVDIEHIDGTPTQRKKRLLGGDADLLVFSIHQTAWLGKVLASLPEDHALFDLLLIDEISKFRQPRSKLARALEGPVLHRFENRWGLTGTPKPNGYEDLFKPYEFISGGAIWGGEKYDPWLRSNFMPMDYHGYTWKVHTFAARKIDRLVDRWTTTVDVNLDLPPLNAGADWDIEIDLADDCRTAYDEMLKEFVIETGGDPVLAASAAIQSGKLSQLTQGFVYQREVDEDGDATTEVAARYDNAKLAALKNALDDINEPVIICYQYRESLAQLLRLLGEDTPYLGGGVDAKRKMRLVDDFVAGKLPYLLVHPASMGHGVDGLQQAGRLFLWYDLPWGGEQYDQTIKRLDRPGQTKPVISRRIVARGTVDLVKRARVEGKGAEQEAWITMLSERGLV